MIESGKVAVFASGCFWCTEAIFKRLNGISNVQSGYTGGTVKNPCYREVCNGNTGHAEAIKFIYDPAEISYVELLEIFFNTHNPTTLNRQGNDIGSQYRSAIFYSDDHQKKLASDYINMLNSEEIFKNQIVTQLSPLNVFYPAEIEHSDYYDLNKSQPYCTAVITPKVLKFKSAYSNKLKKI